ncbi:flippase [Pseudomonas resinovorans]|uniref:Flippase n=1 Tax=Metapseudomonas resinovorans TaxID=53412 RepID=A0ABT4YB99_METRE|nr:flippase [Pseudomonas resinovorans]MDA8486162.1 flippase [Pseudomonas resinovorans]
MIKTSSALKKALRAVSLLWAGSLLSAGLAFFTQIVLARELAPSGYGAFAAALATVTLLAPLAGVGVQGFWLKVFGAEGWHAVRWLSASFRVVLFSSIATVLLLFAWALLGGHTKSTSILLICLLPIIPGYLFNELVGSKFQLEERFSLLAAWQLIPHFMRLILILCIVLIGWGKPSALTIAAVYALVAFLICAIGCVSLRKMAGGDFALKGHSTVTSYEGRPEKVFACDVIAQSWPFGLAAVFQLIYFQSDVILLKYMIGDGAAGVYNVAFTVMAAVYLLPSVIYQKFLLPKMHRWANSDRARFYKVYRQGNFAMLLLGVAAMLAIWLSAFWAIPLFFGKQYTEAVTLLNILAPCAPLMFLAFSFGGVLVTQENMRLKVKVMGGVALINVLMNIALIPTWGAIGAAISTVLSCLALMSTYFWCAQKIVFGHSEGRDSECGRAL